MIKPRFRAKWKNFVVNHDGEKIAPFPGRNPTRWAISDVVARGYPCLYEGKRSVQAVRIAFSKPTTTLYLLEFDRKGVFFIQHIPYGDAGAYDYVAIPQVWRQYHKEGTFREVADGFRKEAKRGVQG